MRESSLYNPCRLAASECGVVLFRNQRYKGQIVKDGKITEARADCGLTDGASDLIGWDSQGRFVAIEVKVKGNKPSPDQVSFIEAVRAAGGIAGVVYGPEDVKKLFVDKTDT